MKFKILIILIFFITAGFISSCSFHQSEKRTRKPSHFLNQDEMVAITVDFRLTEAAIRQMAGYGENTKIVSEYYYKKMLKKHHITAEDYKENLIYYAKKPDELHKIYDRVTAKITELQTELSTRK